MTTISLQEIHPDWTDPLTWIYSHHYAHRIRLVGYFGPVRWWNTLKCPFRNILKCYSDGVSDKIKFALELTLEISLGKVRRPLLNDARAPSGMCS